MYFAISFLPLLGVQRNVLYYLYWTQGIEPPKLLYFCTLLPFVLINYLTSETLYLAYSFCIIIALFLLLTILYHYIFEDSNLFKLFCLILYTLLSSILTIVLYCIVLYCIVLLFYSILFFFNRSNHCYFTNTTLFTLRAHFVRLL